MFITVFEPYRFIREGFFLYPCRRFAAGTAEADRKTDWFKLLYMIISTWLIAIRPPLFVLAAVRSGSERTRDKNVRLQVVLCWK